jgi:fucose permease
VTSESGISAWIPTYLRLDKGFSFMSAGSLISYFWLSLTLGRILFGFLSGKIRIRILLLFMTFFSTATIAISVYINNGLLIKILVILSGLFLSSVHPFILTLGTLFYPRYKNFLVPLLIMIGGAGGIISPWLIGLIFEKYSIFIGINLIPVFQFLSFLSLLVFIFSSRGRLEIDLV